jgi:hypothetical protein
VKTVVRLFICCAVLLGTIPAAASSYNNMITDEQYSIVIPISVASGQEVTITMSRISGDLLPFLVLRDSAKKNLEVSEVEENSWQVVIKHTFAQKGNYEIVATRQDVDEGKTSGDFILNVDGVIERGTPFPTLDTPAIVLFGKRSIEGTVTNQTFQTTYLVYLQRGQTINAKMERKDGDLQPLLGLLDTDNKLVQRGESEETVSTLQARVNKAGWYLLTATRFEVDEGTTRGKYQLTFSIQ